MKAIEE